MRKLLLIACALAMFSMGYSQSNKVQVNSGVDGQKLTVDGKDFFVTGMNWDYFPIGTNYAYDFWGQPDEFIQRALDKEMALLKNMGVNTVRMYTGVQAKWIRYIYEKYGIYTMLNHSFGRYGLTIDGVWTPVTNYADQRTQELLLSEVRSLATEYKNTPGLLLFLLGNENNYGLFWAGAETEDFPDEEDQKRAVGENRGRPMYKLMNEASKIIKGIDGTHPVAICNGDLLFLDIVAEECPDVDIYGTNMYRGASFGDAFERVKKEYGKPILFTEFGSDAFNAKENQEDQEMQAYYMVENWKDIYANAAGLGKAGNSLGGFTFQFSDGWWKYKQTEDLDVHNTKATWANGGYPIDLAEGENNMNEEWFGICAKGPTSATGHYDLYPRAAYYALKTAHEFNPYAPGATAVALSQHFDQEVQIVDAMLRARGDKAALSGGGASGSKIRLSQLTANFTSFHTGGSLISTPRNDDPTDNTFPNRRGFDHMQSYFIGVEAQPSSNMRAEVKFNVLGNVAQNPIDEIFYENRGRPVTVEDTNGEEVVFNDFERLRVYQAEFEWNTKPFDIRGFYRTGHYHWQYEGDFFGLYPEANYGPNLDIYGGEILGFEVDGKKAFDGLKAAFGPQLWWAANPTALLKYRKHFKGFDITGIYHRDFNTALSLDETGRRILDANQTRSGVLPPFPTERATLVLEKDFGKIDIAVGGIWGGRPLNGSSFQVAEGGPGNYTVFTDEISGKDNWGGKAKIKYEGGKFNWYAQGAIMGLVANGGADATQTFTGWRLRDSGSGNQTNFLTGFTYQIGKLTIAPNFLWQKPIVDPMPNDITGPGRLRNFIDDPFVVRANRETTAGEILLTFDPTPGTWMYAWDNDRVEDAKFAMNLGFVYRHLPTTQDAHVGFQADRTFLIFPNSAPAVDLWEVHSRMVSRVNKNFGIIGNFYYGNGQANGDDQRTINRFGGDIRAVYKKMQVQAHVKFNDWGPFDYHRDFNLTFPTQLMLDVSTNLGKPDWFILPTTRVGIRGTYRTLNGFSPRYCPTVDSAGDCFEGDDIPTGFDHGQEWEIRTYITINIGK